MKNTYSMAVVAECPKGGRDEYRLTVDADGIIEVEVLIDIVKKATARPAFQEAITSTIAIDLARLRNGVRGVVQLEGVHSGVKVVTKAEFGA